MRFWLSGIGGQAIWVPHRAHILPTIDHQAVCLSVSHSEVFLQVEPFPAPDLTPVEIDRITAAMVAVADSCARATTRVGLG
jgi:hypothetical protein